MEKKQGLVKSLKMTVQESGFGAYGSGLGMKA